MANRSLTNNHYSFKKKLCSLFLVADIAALGAPTLNKVESQGVSDIVRTAAGRYQIQLQDKWVKLVSIRGVIEAVAAEDLSFQIESYDLSAKTINIITHASGGDSDPSSGSVLRLEVLFNDTIAR